jgi:hypothetical protein
MNIYQETSSFHIMNLQEVSHRVEQIKTKLENDKNNFLKKNI